jgi:hypothetical protein
MEDLDAKIDALGREKIFSLIAENSVRFKKINVRHTGNNNKNSLEHLNELVSSYERLLRAMPKEFFKIEQTIRLKFLAPLDEKRKIRILSSVNEDMELIQEQMISKFQGLYKVHGQEEDFIARMDQIKSRCKENADKQMEKMAQFLQNKLETSTSIPPAQLEKKYGIDQASLHQLHLIKVLQDMNSMFDTFKNEGADETILNAVHEAIVERIKLGKELERMLPSGHQVVARKEWRMRVAKESVRLKEMILSINILAGYIQKPKEQRNFEVIKKHWKHWGRIEESFEEIPEEKAEIVLSKLKPYYHLLEYQNQ